MAESSWPTVAGSRAVDDVSWERMASGFSTDGIIGVAADTTVVYGDSTGMQVKVRANKLGMVRGHGWFSGAAEFNLAIGANASGSTRIDLVVLRFTRSTQEVHIVIHAGTAGAGAPALTQDAVVAGSGVWEVAVGQVTVVNGAATISATAVVSLARYIGTTYSYSPSWLRHTAGHITASDRTTNNALTIAGSWTNTSAPGADGPTPAPPYYSGSALNVPKVSGSTRFMCTVMSSGFSNNYASSVTFGVRIGGTNYPVAFQYFNLPQDHNSAQPTYTAGGPGVGGQDVNGNSIASVSTGGNFTGVDYPFNWAPGNHAHADPPHYHTVSLPTQHMPVHGFNVVGAGLPPGVYTAWLYIATTGSFVMDYNDFLHLTFQEIDS